MFKNILFLTFFLFPATILAQKANMDSLLSVVRKSSQNAMARIKIAEVYMNNTNKVDSAIILANEVQNLSNQPDTIYGKSYNILGNCFKSKNKLDTAQGFYDKAIKLFVKAKYSYGQASSLYNSSGISSQKGKFDEAIQKLLKAETILNTTTHEKKEILLSMIYSWLSENYKNIGLYDKAMEYYLKSDKIATSANDITQQAIVYDGIARTYTQMAEFSNAIPYYKKALQLSKQSNFQAGILRIPLNIASTYFQYSLYDSSRRSLLLDSAELAVKDLNDTYLKYNIKSKSGVYYMLLGQIAQYRKNYANSISLYDSAIAISKKSNMGSDLAKSLASKGDVLEKSGDIPTAIKFYTEAIELFKQNKAKNDLKQAYYHLAKLYYGQGDYSQAAKYYDLYYPLLNEILDEEKIKTTKQFAAKFELSKKEAQISQQNAELIEKEQNYKLVSQQFELSKQKAEIESQKQKVELLVKEKMIADKETEIFMQARENELREKEQVYQTSLKEATIVQQKTEIKAEKQRNLWLIIGSVFLASTILVLGFLYKIIRNKNKIIQGQKSEILHFHDNSLSQLRSMFKRQSELQLLGENVKTNEERVRILSILHELLHGDGSFSGDLKDYLNKICDVKSKETDIDINCTIVETVKLKPSYLKDIGIIINEIITNAVKYAFQDVNPKLVLVKAERRDNNLYLHISDNGNGLPVNFDPQKTTGFGMGYVNDLIEQHDGEMKFYNKGGANFEIKLAV